MNTVQSSHGGGGSGKEKGIEVSSTTACTIIITHNMLYHYNVTYHRSAHVIMLWITRVPVYTVRVGTCVIGGPGLSGIIDIAEHPSATHGK